VDNIIGAAHRCGGIEGLVGAVGELLREQETEKPRMSRKMRISNTKSAPFSQTCGSEGFRCGER
jgi:hypothetical protein